MASRGVRGIAGAGGIAAAGAVTLVAHLFHLLVEDGLHAVMLGVLLPILLSASLLGAGVRIYRGDFEDALLLRITGWTGVGAVGGVAFGYPIVPYQAAHGVGVVDVPYLLATWATAGAIAGVLIGFYDARRHRYRTRLEKKRDELLARERELQRENERLDTFAGLVSHDLRNPLNVATGRLELARETGDPGHLAAVEGALERMDAIIDDMLAMAREGDAIEDADLGTVTLSEVATACWADTGDADLDIEDDRRLRADESRLKHVFENLYRNAVEHSGGPVTVRVGPLEGGFYVEDTGPGIPAAERERVFEAGYTTDRGGTGLGLSLVETIAGAHGWAVTITESREGGARFEFTGVSTP